MTEIAPSLVPEAMSVQLTRMEGKLNVIAERISNLGGRVDAHEREIVTVKSNIFELQSLTQTLQEGADADKKTAVALALALKEADETRRTKSEQTWTPFQRGIALIVGMGALVALYLAFVPTP